MGSKICKLFTDCLERNGYFCSVNQKNGQRYEF